MLASICAQAEAVAVVGTHGKTTTTSMLALILQAADPATSFLVGGDLQDAGTGARWAGGRWLVVEADESDGTHLELPVHAAILTNVESDHLDHYGTFEAMVAGFDAFLAQVPGPRVVCIDDPLAAGLAEAHGAVTYGTSAGARYRAVDIGAIGGRWHFTVQRDGVALGEVELPLRGLHNVRNATGAIALADALGVPRRTTTIAGPDADRASGHVLLLSASLVLSFGGSSP
jgi:UDP-N-acetylmuramate--alanine ligase